MSGCSDSAGCRGLPVCYCSLSLGFSSLSLSNSCMRSFWLSCGIIPSKVSKFVAYVFDPVHLFTLVLAVISLPPLLQIFWQINWWTFVTFPSNRWPEHCIKTRTKCFHGNIEAVGPKSQAPVTAHSHTKFICADLFNRSASQIQLTTPSGGLYVSW